MTITLRTHARASALSVLTVTALAAALTAAPARPHRSTTPAPATVPVTPAPGPSVRTVTMLTGDRVVLRTDADGRTTASITPDSPHPGVRSSTSTPARTPGWCRSSRPPSGRVSTRRSSTSVRSGGPGPAHGDLRPRHHGPATCPGLDVRTSSARRAASGRTTATASYDAAGRCRPASPPSLSGVASIARAGRHRRRRLARPCLPAAHPDHRCHRCAQGRAAAGRRRVRHEHRRRPLFGAFGEIVDGQWKVSVPTGNYAIISDDFSHVVVKHGLGGRRHHHLVLDGRRHRQAPADPPRPQVPQPVARRPRQRRRRPLVASTSASAASCPRSARSPPCRPAPCTPRSRDLWSAKGYQRVHLRRPHRDRPTRSSRWPSPRRS